MKITGQFRDLFDNLYTVEIENTSISADDIVIGEKYNTDEEQDGLLYFTDEAVETEQEMDDLFTKIAMQSATINLLAKEFVADKFFADNDKSVTVKIYKGDNIIFDGYVEPGTFDQEFTNPFDEFSLNCIDKLSTLQYHKYKDIDTLAKYSAALPHLGVVTFKSLLDECLGEFGGNIYYDMSKGINKNRCNLIFNDLKISEKEMVGDDYDSVWSKEDVLNEVLQYLNLHIRQVGSDFYIFDWENIMAKNTAWVNLNNNEYVTLSPQAITLNADMNASEDTSVSIDDVYNQISVTCDLESQDNVVESPLDDDALTSLFNNKQKYMTEYISEGEGTSAINAFKAMVSGGNTDYDAATKIDWYLQWLQAENWKLYSASGNVESMVEYDSNGMAINQYKASERLRNGLCEPAILSLGSVTYEAGRITDDSPISSIDMSNYLCISLNGSHSDADGGCTTWYPQDTDLEARAQSPIIEYLGANSGGVFSPTDDETTNYMVVTGKLCFIPIQAQTDVYSKLHQKALEPDNGYYEYPYDYVWNEYTEEYEIRRDEDGNPIYNYDVEPTYKYTSGGFTAPQNYWHKTVPSDNNDDGRYYTRKWYQLQYYNGNPDNAPISDYGFHPLTKDKSNHSLSYDYTYIGNQDPEGDDYREHYNDWDLTSNVDVLDCELIIGDKRLVQFTSSSGDTLQWVKLGQEPEVQYEGKLYKKTTFSVGINPKIGDKLVGDEFEIRTNVDFTYNIDGGGFAIPIKKSDALTGQVIFRILGPVNNIWYTVTRRHPTLFRHTEYYAHKHYILAHAESIIIKDFKIEFQSDNAGINTDYKNDENDLVYISQETEKYLNKYDDPEFKFITQPTTEEAIAAGCSTETNYNAVINATTDIPLSKIYNAVTKDSYKAEQYYVNQYYLCYNKPKVLLDTDVWDSDNINYLNIYTYKPLNRQFFVKSMTRELYNNKVHLTLREINDD